MNAEIYFPRNGKAFGQTSEKSFEDTVKKLNSMNVNIIYKTEVNLTADSIVEALKVSESGEEKIGIIFIADVLTEDDPEKAKSFFESIGILSKVRRIESECKNPEAQEKTEDHSAGKDAEKNKKKAKKAKKQKPEESEESEELIDISAGEVKIEKKKLFVYVAEYNNKLVALLPCHEILDTNFNEVIYTAAKKLVSPKKKGSFWKRFIPCGGDRPIDVIRKIILLLAICTFIVSSIMLINIMIVEPAINRHTTDEIRGLLVSTPDGEDTKDKKPTDGSEGVLADFAKLLEVNPDTVGWITVPNTVIDYVIVKPQGDEDPEYYLHRDFYGNYSKYGTVFMDYRSDLDSKNMILHGHHMQDGSMFANLVQYDELDFYKTAAVFDYNTLYEKAKWKIISVFKTNTLESHGPFFNYLRGSFSSDYDFLNFVYELRVRSIIDCPVDVNENDTLVTLSTCTYDMEDFRFVVVARKVRDGEESTVDLKKAKLNPNPVYPQGWYNWFGGVRPEVTSFQDALNNGLIDWYDGNGKWSEKDDEELKRQLLEGKDNAITKLSESYDPSLYADVQIAEIKAIIAKYSELFAAAERSSEINDLYAQALDEISKVKTREQVESELQKSEEDASKEASEAALQEVRNQAIMELNNAVAGVEYRLTQASLVNDVIQEYSDLINKAESADEVKKLKEEGIEQLKKIKTNEQLNAEESRKEESSRKAAEESSKKAAEESSRKAAEEASRKAEESRKAQEEASRKAEESSAAQFAQYKENAVSALTLYLDLSQYPSDTQAAMSSVISQYSADIRNAASESAVDSLLNEAKSQLDQLAASSQQESSSEEESSEEENNEV